MSATPTPWRVERGTDIIWGACNPEDSTSYGMGYSIVEGHAPSWSSWAKGKPDMDEREANAALIVKAVNAHQPMLEALQAVVREFGDSAYPEWNDAITALAVARGDA